VSRELGMCDRLNSLICNPLLYAQSSGAPCAWKKNNLHSKIFLLTYHFVHCLEHFPFFVLFCGTDDASREINMFGASIQIPIMLGNQPKIKQVSRHNSSANCARELFKPLKDLAILWVCSGRKFFGLRFCFFVSGIISEVVFLPFLLMLHSLGPN